MIDALPLLLGPEGYQISRSVRLRSSASAYFSRTQATPTNNKIWTWSGWVKKGLLTSDIYLFAANNSTAPEFIKLSNSSSDAFEFAYWNGSAWAYQLRSTMVLRDPSAWYHIVVSVDTTQATASNRVRLYVNGVEVTSFSISSYPSQNTNTKINSAVAARLGSGFSSAYFDGYLTEINFIDGQALTPASFGETDAVTGVWKPKKYAGTYGTNGFYLNFSDNSAATAATIGADYSGNGNNWTPNNISVTAGATYDSMLDVPTQWADGGNGRGNYCTLNPIHYNNATVTESNLKHTSAGAGSVGRGTVAVSSGKWYYEFTLTSLGSVGSFLGGIIDSQQPNNTPTNLATVTGAMWLYRDDGYIANGGGSVNTGVTYTNNDVISVAFDVDGQKIWWAKNGTWLSSGNPAAGTNAQYTNVSSTANSFMPFVNEQAATSAGVFNFGQRPFAYTPPTGFKALNTLNLPEPTILKGNQYFDAITYSGNSTYPRTIGGLNFQPDLVWQKARSITYDHILYDAVRGTGTSKSLSTNITSAEGFNSAYANLTAFAADGFTVDTTSGTNILNNSGQTYVAWQWKEGATQGFDIVTYTGTGVARTVSHSLGVAPSMMIVKRRNTTSDWIVWHSAFAGTEYIALNSTAAKATGATIWNSTSPTSSVFSVGTSGATNGNTDTYVAYLFAEVAGFSKFGAYTGNGSSDGPFVFCGFRPRYVMLKASSTTEIWIAYDSSRNTYNVADLYLYPNSSAAEAGSGTPRIDFLSNGFKLRNTGQGNVSAVTYIFAAFAESPFKNALAR